MAGNGFYNARSVMMLNALIGNLSLEGGVFVGGGKFNGCHRRSALQHGQLRREGKAERVKHRAQ